MVNPLRVLEFKQRSSKSAGEIFPFLILGEMGAGLFPCSYGWSERITLLDKEIAIRSECILISYIVLPSLH